MPISENPREAGQHIMWQRIGELNDEIASLQQQLADATKRIGELEAVETRVRALLQSSPSKEEGKPC